MKVQNMTSPNGNDVPNQFIIKDDKGSTFFQSYDSTIAKLDREGRIFLDSYYWEYSRTTSKYRNQFLGMDTKGIKRAIKEGSIELVNLNAED